MYSTKPAFVYGFHGLDQTVGMNIVTNKSKFKVSHNKYDWLGDGIYFWENNKERAAQYAEENMERKGSTIKIPFVLGAVIDLGNCLDLLDQKNLDFLYECYELLKQDTSLQSKVMPTNGTFGPNDFDFKKRELDCAVIRYAYTFAKQNGVSYDSVRAAFWEGDELYPGAGFKKQNHIQLAILNPNCIKGIFIPREKENYP